MSKNPAIIASLAALAACSSSPQPPAGLIVPPDAGIAAPVAPSGRECSNAGLERFSGQPATAAVAAEMLRVSGARTIRWVQPGMAVTMDFSPERLTVQLRAGNVIDRASCG